MVPLSLYFLTTAAYSARAAACSVGGQTAEIGVEFEKEKRDELARHAIFGVFGRDGIGQSALCGFHENGADEKIRVGIRQKVYGCCCRQTFWRQTQTRRDCPLGRGW